MIVFVNNDMGLQELFFHTFHQTNQVFCFSDMYDAYKWAKKNKKSPSIIISEVDLQDPSGLQAIKFLETKNNFKNTRLVAFTLGQVEKEEINLIISEGADAVFSRQTLLNDISSYLKYIKSTQSKNKKQKLIR